MSMKTLKATAAFLLIIMTMCFSFTACNNSAMVGVWETEIDGETGVVEFTRNNKSIIKVVDDAGEEVTKKGSYRIMVKNLRLNILIAAHTIQKSIKRKNVTLKLTEIS